MAEADEVAYLRSREGYRALAETLRRLNADLHRQTEIAEARSLANADSPAGGTGDMWVTAGFEDLLRAQAGRWEVMGLCRCGEGRPVYVVGGGALPQSQWVLHRCTGRRIVSVERDPASVTAARTLIAKWGLAEALPVVLSDGRDCSYSDAVAVVVATLVTEKLDIAERVALTAPYDAVLNVRVPVGLHEMWRAGADFSSLAVAGWVLRDRWGQPSSAIASLTYTRRAP